MDFKDYFKFKEGTKDVAMAGGLCVLEKILYFLFKSPFVLWRMSCKHLKEIRTEAKLDIEKIDGPIPFILFLIRFTLDFLLHALIFISLVISPIAAIAFAVKGLVEYHTVDYFFSSFIATFAACYYAPVGIRLVIELLEIIKKYGVVILKFVFAPLSIICYFLLYLAKKCMFKTAKYEKKLEEINKE